jgi:hypothetical protein
MNENRHIRRSLARSRTTTVRVRSQSFWGFALLALLALAIQSFVVQTHIHIPKGEGRVQTVSFIILAAQGLTSNHAVQGPRDNFLIDEDPSNCPLCQEVAHSGQFVASAASLAYLPVTATVSFIVFTEVAPAIFAASHTWRGRAPPQA